MRHVPDRADSFPDNCTLRAREIPSRTPSEKRNVPVPSTSCRPLPARTAFLPVSFFRTAISGNTTGSNATPIRQTNIMRQSSQSARKPPIPAEKPCPRKTIPMNMPTPCGLLDGAVSSPIIASETAMIPAAKKPATKRQTISQPNAGARTQPTVASVNPARIHLRTDALPNRSARCPYTGCMTP